MALSASRARVLAAVSSLGGAGGRPVTLAELAGALGGHPNTSRQHLDALVASGLLDARDVARASSGRRPRGYTLSDAGRRSLAPAGEDGSQRPILQVESVHPNAGLLQTIQVFNQRDVDILSVETLAPNLETVFLRLTGKSLRD